MAIDALTSVTKSFIGSDSTQINKCDNLGLLVDRLNEKIDCDGDKSKYKNNALESWADFNMLDDFCEAYGSAFEKRRRLFENAQAKAVKITTVSKAMLGIGNDNVHEAGVNLLNTWGVPYISGSTLKGAASDYLRKYLGENWEIADSVKSDNQIQVFGGTKDGKSYIGDVAFIDAWAVVGGDRKWFERDIITPNYSEYYSGSRMPDGMEDPVPINTISLKRGIEFEFYLTGSCEAVEIVLLALDRLLTEEGIGGKTAVGYGRFKLSNEYVDNRRREDNKCAIVNQIKNAESLLELSELLVDNNSPCRAYKAEINLRAKELFGESDDNDKYHSLFKNYCPENVLLHKLNNEGESIKNLADIKTAIYDTFDLQKKQLKPGNLKKKFCYRKNKEMNEIYDKISDKLKADNTCDDSQMKIFLEVFSDE